MVRINLAAPIYRVVSLASSDAPEAEPVIEAWLESLDPLPRPKGARTVLRERKREIGYCEACFFRPAPDMLSRSLHTHHVKARADGGLDDLENILVLCARCHALAHAVSKGRSLDSTEVLMLLDEVIVRGDEGP